MWGGVHSIYHRGKGVIVFIIRKRGHVIYYKENAILFIIRIKSHIRKMVIL